MKRRYRHVRSKLKIFFAVILLFAGVFCAGGIFLRAENLKTAAENGGLKEAVILFTHDTHSHVYPAYDKDGNEYGGYTRLYTLIKRQRSMYPDSSVITLDGGDFSMGTLFQTIYMTDACELRLLGSMGYDVVTFGNHEFEYRDDGLAAMLEAALASKEELPQIVDGNYYPPVEGDENYTENSRRVWEAFKNYGVKEYTVLERDGVRYGIFGIFGEDSHECSPMSGMVFEPPIDAAKHIVADIKQNENCDYIICLSHSGTDEKKSKSEDYNLAKSVDGIDVIISGHTHTTLTEPLIVNDTIIVSAGEYTKNLGVLKIAKDSAGNVAVVDYSLIPVDNTVEEDKKILAAAIRYKKAVSKNYLSAYGMKYDEVLAYSGFGFEPISDVQKELPLGNLIADSYIYAVKQAEGSDYVPVDFALVAKGVIRGTFSEGEITVADAFNVSSLGIGPDGRPGYPLVSIYIKGSELKNVFEIDASVALLMPSAQLYGAGMGWSYNTKRMFFNKVTEAFQITDDGKRQEIDDNRLYRVVVGLYESQMLSAAESKSYGILKLTPYDENGNAVTDFESKIVYDKNGNEVKAWYALASYLKSLSVMPERYLKAEGRKNVYASYNPLELLKGANWITVTVIIIALILIVIIIFVLACLRRRRRRRNIHRKY